MHRGEDEVKIDLKEERWVGMDWLHPFQDRNEGQAVVNLVLKLQILE